MNPYRRVVMTLLSIATLASCAYAQAIEFPPGSRVINASDFGAVGDGLTDDTAAINAALAASRVPGSSAKLVYLPAGTYRITDTISFPESRIVMQGAGEGLTLIKLDDNAPGFEGNLDTEGNRITRNAVSTRESPGFSANQFRVSVRDLTIDIGSGNLGANGLKYHNNNQGTVRNVTIRSSDPGKIGTTGLLMTGTDKGPGMIRSVTIDGFDRAIQMGGTEYSMIFEDITLIDQNEYAIFNVWNIMTFRGLTTSGTVPVLWHDLVTQNDFSWGLITIIDGNFTGVPGTAALLSDSSLYLRNCTSIGFDTLVEQGGIGQAFTSITEWTSDRVEKIWASPNSALNLAIEDVPTVAWDDPVALPGNPSGWWANVEDPAFGADGTDGASDGDDAIGVQAAIDSGATTVMLPAGRYHFAQPVVLRGDVRRIIMMEGDIDPIEPLLSSSDALFVTDPSNPGPVVIERGTLAEPATGSSFLHNTPGTLVVRNVTGGEYRGSGSGKAFLEDIVSGPHQVTGGQRVWFRQLNPENAVTKLIVDDADVVVLGMKTEKQGTPIAASNGANVELLGGLIYPVGTLPLDQPMFSVDNANFSAVIGESSFVGRTDHKIIVEQTRDGETRRFFDSETEGRVGFFRGVRLCLYSGSDGTPPLRSDPIAYYPLDQTSGTNVPDATSNANDGTATSGTLWTTGQVGNAIAFNGVDQFVELVPGTLNSGAGAVSFWMNSTQAPDVAGHMVYFAAGLTGNGGGNENEAHVTLSPTGEITFFINGASDLSLDSNAPFNDGAWHHVVASWDLDGYADLYVDGRRVDRRRAGNWNAFTTGTGRVRLARPNANDRYYEGLLDEVRLWDRPVTHDEVYDLFNSERGFANYPPNVEAGRDQIIQEPSFSRALEGQAVDDLQPSGTFNVSWSVVDGPLGPGAGVTFDGPSDPTATATFAQAGTYTLRLTGDDTVASDSDEVTASVFDPLLAPWDNDDVGNVGELGWVLQPQSNAFTLNASGRRVGGNPASGADTFHYAYQETLITNGQQIVARIESVENTATDARAGVMYRSSLGGSASNAFVYATGDGRVGFTVRSGSGGGTATVQEVSGVTLPVYVRVRRISTNTFRGDYSADGVVWTELANETPPTPTTVNMGGGAKLVGLAACAGNNNLIGTSVMEEVFVGEPCVADFDRDGDVDLGDFGVFGAAFNAMAGDANYNAGADFDADGDVDLGDFGVFGTEFNVPGCAL